MRVRVIAFGQAAAGDDGVALVVLARLRERGVPAEVELVHAGEDVALVSLLETPRPIVLVDAVLGTPCGAVLELTPEQLARGGRGPVSTHGIGVGQAIALARALAPEGGAASIRIVAVTISRPQCYEQRLSPEVAAAVPAAVERVLGLIGG